MKQATADAKRKANAQTNLQVNAAIHRAIREKVQAVTRPVLEQLVRFLFLDGSIAVPLWIIKGWGLADDNKLQKLARGGKDSPLLEDVALHEFEKEIEARLPKLSDLELARILLDISVSEDLLFDEWVKARADKSLGPLAKALKVDAAAIDKDVRTKAAEAARRQAQEVKATPAQAPSKKPAAPATPTKKAAAKKGKR